MDLTTAPLLTVTPKEAAKIMYEAGRTLRGKNLRRGSWLEIAHALRVQRTAVILLPRLQAATTREDALRVPRLARKWARVRKSGGAKHAKAVVRPTTIIAEDTRALDAELEQLLYWDRELELIFYDNVRDPEYLRYLDAPPPTVEQLLQRDLLPASPLHGLVVDFAFAQRLLPERPIGVIGSVIDAATYQRLVRLSQPGPLAVDEGARRFLAQYQLIRLQAWLSTDFAPFAAAPAPIQDGYELAGLALLARWPVLVSHWTIAWTFVVAWLLDRLTQPLAADWEAAAICAIYLSRTAPADIIRQIAAQLDRLHTDWRPILFAWLARRHDLFPRLARARLTRATTTNDRPHASPPPWEELAAIGFGSWLVLHDLWLNARTLLTHDYQPAGRFEPDLSTLLLSGAGTLQRMDYPAFTLTCRPAVTLTKLSTFAELVRLGRELGQFGARVITRPLETILDTIAACHGRELSAETRAALAETITQHAIAYVLLTRRVLAEALAQQPFRLRRKHIQTFWREQAAGAYPDLVIPASLAEMRLQIEPELLKASVVHALLDHFKDQWPDGTDKPIGLKEELIYTLRLIALTYQQPFIHLPIEPTADDLVRAPEITDFLIGQMIHAPLEIAQRLNLPPQQGLPLLSGGHYTTLERAFRQALREAAGSLKVITPDAEAKVFECRPISKRAALNRGALGGDCSTDNVPFRALSPHHVYYGVYADGQQQRGYMTVYEAWAESGPGQRQPVLCLETINVPIRAFDAVQGDLLEIFSALAHSRGLQGLVLITDSSTWNYQNAEVLRLSQRFRRGTPVNVLPADPVHWRVYGATTPKAEWYTVFAAEHRDNWTAQTRLRLLAPLDPAHDRIQPENQAEADRLRALPPRKLIITARTDQQIVGFISELPTVW